MSSCPYLDPASLLAQKAVSIRLGRRASNSSHTLLATARRAPLNESSVQSSTKQPSTAASAPAQVFQSVSVDHLGQRATNCEDATVDCVLPPRHGEPRRRSALPRREGALQIAVRSPEEHAIEEPNPSLQQPHTARQPLPELLHAHVVEGEDDTRSEATNDPQHDQVGYYQHRVSSEERYSSPAQPSSDTADRALQPQVNYECGEGDQRRVQHRLGPRRPRSSLASPARPSLPAEQAGLSHVTALSRDSSELHHQRTLQPPLRQTSPSDWGQGGNLLSPAGAVAVGTTAAGTALVRFSSDSTGAPYPMPGTSNPASHSRTFTVGAAARGAASTSTRGALPPAVLAEAERQPGVPAAALTTPSGTTTNGTAIDYPPLAPMGLGPLAEKQQQTVSSEGPSGGRWGGLESELLACRSVHSVQRFLQLMGPRTDAELLGNAVVHLSHLVSEEPPDGDVERQLLAGLLDELTQRLRGCVRQLGRGQMTALVCAMSRLRCYDGPLLREVVMAAREAAGEFTTRQAGGLVWAFGRYHRDFSFRLELGWTAALLQGALPRLPQAKPQEVAMMLYGSALLREPPPAAALAALLAASLSGMSAANGPELSMTIWALATLRLYPGVEWMRTFLGRCDAATRTFARGAAVSNVLYSLASMRVQPPAPWMLNFLWQAQRRMNTMDAQSLVMMWWALGRMRYRPDRKWLTRFFRYTRSAVLLHSGPDSHIAAASFVQQQVQRHSPYLQTALQTASQQQLELRRRRQQQRQHWPGPWGTTVTDGGTSVDAGALPPQGYNILLWACVRLSCRPMGRWLPLLCTAVQPLLAAWPPHELSALLWGLARLRWRPRDDWMTEFCAAARGSLSLFQPPDCVMTLLALSKLCSGLGYRVSDGDLANLLAQRLAPYYSRLQTTTLISVLLAVSRVTPRVRAGRMEEVLAAVLDRVLAIVVADAPPPAPADTDVASSLDRALDLDKQQEMQLNDEQVRSGISRSGYQQQREEPQVGAREEMEPQLNITQSVNPPQPLIPSAKLHLSRSQHSVARRFASSPPPAAAAATVLPSMTARECANAVFAVGCVALWPGYNDALRNLCGQLLRELLPHAFLLAPAFNSVDLVLLVQGAAMARARVSPRWMRRHEEQALRRLQAGQLQPGQLRELHRAYHALDYRPELLPPLAPGRGVGGAASPIDSAGGTQGESHGDVQDKSGGAAVAVARSSGRIGVGGVEDGSEDEDGGERGSGAPGMSPELTVAARARRRRTAKLRRRRVTAAIERRVVQARRKASELRRQYAAALAVEAEPHQVSESTPPVSAPHAMHPAFVSKATAERAAGVTPVPDMSRELEAAERELRFRRKAIQRFTAVAQREARSGEDAAARSSGPLA